LTYVLRGLSYEDGVDFVWSTAWELTDELGITNGQFNASNNSLLRGDLALVSLFALEQPMKGSETPLIERLIEAGAVPENADEIVAEAIDEIAAKETTQTPDPSDSGAANQGGNYTDHASIKHTEAVYALREQRIMEGLEDGSFDPHGLFTRAEAAVVITRMILGRELADKLDVFDTGFSDVPDWAKSSVAYLVERGIMNGTAADVFGANQHVTGSQVAVFLLLALDVPGEYSGPSWEMNAILLGMQQGILTDDANFTIYTTREQVALYVFNALNLLHKG